MAIQSPSINDRTHDLLKKIVWNLHEYAEGIGVSNTPTPSINDRDYDLIKKMATSTAMIAESLE